MDLVLDLPPCPLSYEAVCKQSAEGNTTCVQPISKGCGFLCSSSSACLLLKSIRGWQHASLQLSQSSENTHHTAPDAAHLRECHLPQDQTLSAMGSQQGWPFYPNQNISRNLILIGFSSALLLLFFFNTKDLKRHFSLQQIRNCVARGHKKHFYIMFLMSPGRCTHL